MPESGGHGRFLSEQLGHSTTTLIRDTYRSVTKELYRDAADAVASKIKSRWRKTA
jgi:hypothetical protein